MNNEVRLIGLSAVVGETVSVLEHEVKVRGELAPALFDYTASPEEARAWFHTFDPLNEGFNLALALAVRDAERRQPEVMKTMINELNEWPLLASRVGDILLGSVMYGREDNLRARFFDGDNPIESYKSTLSKLSSEVLHLSGVTYEEATDLSLAAEAYKYSGRQILTAYDQRLMRFDGIDTREGMVELTDASLKMTLAIKNTLLMNALEPETGIETPEELEKLDSIRMIGLKELIGLFNLPSMKIYSEKGGSEEPIISLMKLLHDMCQPDSGITIGQRLKMKHLKGPLHEIMWAIDAEMLRRMYPNLYSDITVAEAHPAGDRPEIGRPKMYRSYDYMLIKGQIYDFVQLKSAKQKGKKHEKSYHPAIWLLEEENFMEVNPRRLTSKLRKYLAVAERGYRYEDRRDVEKYIMPSVKWMMQNMAARRKSRSQQILEKLRDHYLPKGTQLTHEYNTTNRQARRAQNKKRLPRDLR